MIMTQLLLVALRGLLPENVRVPIVKLCAFLNAISQKVINLDILPRLQKDVVQCLVSFELVFPPPFFNIMTHLLVHLVEEIAIPGLVFLHNMFPFEKFMGVLKKYVHNHASPEESISKGYGTEEVIEFCVDFIPDLKSIGVPELWHEGRLSRKDTLGKKSMISPDEEDPNDEPDEEDPDLNIIERKVRKWAVSKLATQFNNWKKRLDKDFIQKEKTPVFTGPFEKIRDQWDAFVTYKTTEQAKKRPVPHGYAVARVDQVTSGFEQLMLDYTAGEGDLHELGEAKNTTYCVSKKCTLSILMVAVIVVTLNFDYLLFVNMLSLSVRVSVRYPAPSVHGAFTARQHLHHMGGILEGAIRGALMLASCRQWARLYTRGAQVRDGMWRAMMEMHGAPPPIPASCAPYQPPGAAPPAPTYDRTPRSALQDHREAARVAESASSCLAAQAWDDTGDDKQRPDPVPSSAARAWSTRA
ncbi:hypothetical protein QYE76_059803 [Lolium multiflorum]|uniref:DUF4218 domain-containing protein n=1 Tax=Lolium multiflorum TaxID=4521 RepID=A0AAD8RZA7_LOLMU|nr:hypothetical protein QYE76_059803 [Lolium multiflorum]